MKTGGFHWGPLRPGERERLLAAARRATLTYDHEGSTLRPAGPTAAGLRSRSLEVGAGAADFAAARTALQTWVPHRSIGAHIEPAGQPVIAGANVLVVLGAGPCRILAPNRIVAVVDEERYFAFAYGTLPGHPARGEECFGVEHRADGTVTATVWVRASPATVLGRVGAPVFRGLQALALGRYLGAVADQVRRRRRPGPAGGASG